jgi:tetratricopeptide (TPR) repeat protein
MIKKKAPNFSTLEEVRELIEKGDMDSVPSKIMIDLEKMTRDQFWVLIELARQRHFGHALIHRTFELDRGAAYLRNAVTAGRFDLANREMNSDENAAAVADPEISLEKARALVFQGRYEEALSIAIQAANHPKVELSSRGVLFQLMAHALMELGDLNRSKSYLEAALDIAVSVGNHLGKFSALLFLAKIEAFQNRENESSFLLNSVFDLLISQKMNLRWLLGYYRTRSHVRMASASLPGLESAAKDTQIAVMIARTLGDQLFEARGLIECALMLKDRTSERTLHSISFALEQNEIFESDLLTWIDTLRLGNLPLKPTYTLKRMFESAQNADVSLLKVKLWEESPAWCYDLSNGILIDFAGSAFRAVVSGSSAEKMILALLKANGTMTPKDLFEAAWGLNWNGDRHDNTLKVSVTRFNQQEGSLRIVRSPEGFSFNLKNGVVIGLEQ